ncbi:MAG: c-type cytochrome [Burkholderiales bacterium]|nr:c-type cytochrome [Burkholderiales bacterium]
MTPRPTLTRRARAPAASMARVLLVAAAAAGFSGCAVEVENTRPARELQAERTRPPGSLYAGWRVYVDRCAGCHGPEATGTGNAPDLLVRVRTLGPRAFVNRVLRRYEWNLPSPPPAADGPEREAMENDILQRRAGILVMPAWQGEPRVTAHIADLYAYLAARADGTVGPRRPVP